MGSVLLINSGSTARCVPPSVYMHFHVSVLPERHSGLLFTMPWDIIFDLANLSNPKLRNGPGIPRASRGGAAHGGAAGHGGAGQDGTPTDLFAQETTVPLAFFGIVAKNPEHFSGSANKRKNTCRIQHPDTQRAGRVGAAHGGAAGRGGARWDGTPPGRCTQETTAPLAFPWVEGNCAERLFASANNRNPM